MDGVKEMFYRYSLGAYLISIQLFADNAYLIIEAFQGVIYTGMVFRLRRKKLSQGIKFFQRILHMGLFGSYAKREGIGEPIHRICQRDHFVTSS